MGKIFETCNEFLESVCKDIQAENDVYIFHAAMDGEHTFMQDEQGQYYCDICIDIDGLARELALCQIKQPDMLVMVHYNYLPEDEFVDKYIFIMKSC